MAREFIVKSMRPEAVDKAFAVARMGVSGLSLQQWRRYATGLIRRRAAESGLLSVENRAGTIQGLCGYRTNATPGNEAICSVEFLVALDLVDGETVTTVLLKALEELARRQGAMALRLDLPYGTAATGQLLHRLDKSGHHIERIGLLKPLRGGARARATLRERNHAG